jgi:hypothetical protein
MERAGKILLACIKNTDIIHDAQQKWLFVPARKSRLSIRFDCVRRLEVEVECRSGLSLLAKQKKFCWAAKFR